MQFFRSSIVLTFLSLLTINFRGILASNKDKPHGHKGVLEPFTGKPLSMQITKDDEKKLMNGEAVLTNERSGKGGRGVVFQDIFASPAICMSKIKDIKNYPKYVSTVKKVDVYDTLNFKNGTEKSWAKFDVGILGLRLGYFLALTHEPKYGTYTWSLDYTRNSDFDDNVGHWQVIDHPTKVGWSRVLYSCKVKLFPWIPNFVVNYLTNKALVEATQWVKKESEAQAKQNFAKFGGKSESTQSPSRFFPSWLTSGGYRPSEDNLESSTKNKIRRIGVKGIKMLAIGSIISRKIPTIF